MKSNKCFFCDEPVIWQSTFMASELLDDFKEDDIAQINYYSCPNCGRTYEVYDPAIDERSSYFTEYWD